MYIDIAKSVFKNEIDGIAFVLDKLDTSFNLAIQAILNGKGRLVVCGMGKSGHIGRKIFATMISTGTPSLFMHPAEAFHGDLGMVLQDDVFLAISNSGETDEILKLIPFLKENNNLLISMTGNPLSSLARESQIHLDVGVASEACLFQLAPTTSTTAALVMGDALAIALMSARKFQPANFAKFHPGGSLGRKLIGKVADFMIPAVVIDIDLQFKDLISEISKSSIGVVCVKDKDGNFCGIITDGDIRRYLSSCSVEDILFSKASDLISSNPKVISSTTRCVDADVLMEKYGINSLIVLNDSQEVFLYHNLNRKKS